MSDLVVGSNTGYSIFFFFFFTAKATFSFVNAEKSLLYLICYPLLVSPELALLNSVNKHHEIKEGRVLLKPVE